MPSQLSKPATLNQSPVSTASDCYKANQNSQTSRIAPRVPVETPVKSGSAQSGAEQSSSTYPNGAPERLPSLGAIVYLMQNSPLHRRYTIADLEERFIPSLLHNQFRYYEINGRPIGFVNWAWLTEETETKFKTGQYELAPNEWVGGTSLWFHEFIAPFGHACKMVADLRANVFPKGTPAKALRFSPKGKFKKIAQYYL